MVGSRGGNNLRVNQLRHTIFIPAESKRCNKSRPRGAGERPHECGGEASAGGGEQLRLF